MKKQESTNRTFNIGNISNVSKNKALTGKKENKGNLLVPVKFKVHKDVIEQFHLLRMEYAKKNKSFALSNNVMFSTMILFMEQYFKERGIMKICPDDFKKVVCRKGKRKATSRTFAEPLNEEILFTIKKSVADIYMDLLYSFVLENKEDNIYNDHHSRTYFFYDFISFCQEHRKDLLKFSEGSI